MPRGRIKITLEQLRIAAKVRARINWPGYALNYQGVGAHSSDAHYDVNSFIRKMSLLPGRKDLLHRWTDLPFAGFSLRCREPKRSMLFLF